MSKRMSPLRVAHWKLKLVPKISCPAPWPRPHKLICSANDFSWPLARGVGKKRKPASPLSFAFIKPVFRKSAKQNEGVSGGGFAHRRPHPAHPRLLHPRHLPCHHRCHTADQPHQVYPQLQLLCHIHFKLSAIYQTLPLGSKRFHFFSK